MDQTTRKYIEEQLAIMERNYKVFIERANLEAARLEGAIAAYKRLLEQPELEAPVLEPRAAEGKTGPQEK